MTESNAPRPSKTRLKQQMLELQALGESLLELPDADLVAMNLPERLLDALRDGRKITKRGALYRQKQFIGRLMREIDAAPIKEAMQQRELRARNDNARFHSVERWRDQLITDGDAALELFLQDYGHADRQHLRSLIRDAAHESKQGKAPRSARKLFQYIVSLLE